MLKAAPVFILFVLTDNETWTGKIHPAEALRQYRVKSGIPAKLVVVAMVSNGFSIADPDDGGMPDLTRYCLRAEAHCRLRH